MFATIISFIINECLSPLIEIYMLIVVLKTLKIYKRFQFKLSSLVLLSQYVICLELVILIHPFKNLIQLLSSQGCIFIIILINFKGSFLKKLIGYTLYTFIILIGESLTMILLIGITDLNISIFLTSNYYYSWGVLISKAFEVLSVNIIAAKISIKELNMKSNYKMQIYFLVFFSLLFSFLFIEKILINAHINSNVYTSTAITTSIILWGVIGLILFIFNRVIKQTKRHVEREQLLQQYKIEHKYAQELNNVLDSLRILKHDLKNHISCMWGLVETNNIEDFKIYLSNLTDELEDLNENELIYNAKDYKSNK